MTPLKAAPRRGRPDGVIVGIGVDVTDVSRREHVLARTPPLARRLFAEGERAGSIVQSLAGSFTAKEAVAQGFTARRRWPNALGGPSGLRWTDVVVSHDSPGRPAPQIHGTVAAWAASVGVTTWHLSISHNAGICVAMEVAEG
jgi:holo-[acyl-carrier protein] synthase